MFSSIMFLLSFVSKRLPPPKGHQVLTVYTNILLVLSPCSQVVWAGRDLNSRRHKPSDLQSDPIDHSGTYPTCYFISKESRVRFELTAISVLQTDVLDHFTTETLLFVLKVEPRGIEPRSVDFQSTAYTTSAKAPKFRSAYGIWTRDLRRDRPTF